MLAAICLTLAAFNQMPEWETNIGYLPFSGPLLAETSPTGMDIFISMGDHGLGAWSGTGGMLEGFPVSSRTGVTRRPAAVTIPGSGTYIVYADNAGYVHMIDRRGVEQPGWPFFAGPGIVTGITVMDLDGDDYSEISFGTAEVRTSFPSAVMRTSSSMRTPMFTYFW